MFTQLNDNSSGSKKNFLNDTPTQLVASSNRLHFVRSNCANPWNGLTILVSLILPEDRSINLNLMCIINSYSVTSMALINGVRMVVDKGETAQRLNLNRTLPLQLQLARTSTCSRSTLVVDLVRPPETDFAETLPLPSDTWRHLNATWSCRREER